MKSKLHQFIRPITHKMAAPEALAFVYVLCVIGYLITHVH